MNPRPTERMAWIARCVWRLKCQYAGGTLVPCGDRGLTWAEYIRLVACVLAEYGKEE